MAELKDEVEALKVELQALKIKKEKDVFQPPLPLKYDGSTDLKTYLVQFETLSHEQGWNDDKKGVMLLSKLQGCALEIAASGQDMAYHTMVRILKAHWAPENEELDSQKLQTMQKTTKQTWEDLAFEVCHLTNLA